MNRSAAAAAWQGATSTPSQQARRERMLAAAIELAAQGGYDAVQMREVAERADVALGTLYRYFPSKVHLLVTAMAEQFAVLRDRVLKDVPTEPDVHDRVLRVLTRVNETLGRNPQLSEAMVRAMMFADASVSAEVDRVSAILTSIISRATHGDDVPPSEEDAVIALIIGKVWLSDIVWWLGQRMTMDEMRHDLAVTLRTVLPAAHRRVARH